MTKPRRIVIVGAGFGGLWVAKGLSRRRPEADVLLVDRNNYHTFFPLLYQVAAAELGPTSIAFPVRSVLRGSRVRFQLSEVRRIDLEGHTVSTNRGPIPYDQLVLATGSVPHFFGVPGAERHAFTLRNMEGAISLRQHILTRFERAALEGDAERRRAMLRFVIVGGGPTGVEYAGALGELLAGPVRDDYPMFGDGDASVVLVERGDDLLPGMPARLQRYARERLERRGVEARLGATAGEVGADGLTLASGEHLASQTVVWTAGVRGASGGGRWGLPEGPGGRIPVGPALNLQSHAEVFVLGDLAYVEDDRGRPLPQVAPVAIQQARVVVRNLELQSRGKPLKPFRFRDPGMIAVIGRNAAAAHIGGRSFTGFPAWLLWIGIHIAKLIGFRNRALVLVNWAWNYVRFRHGVRLILPRDHSVEEDPTQ